MKFIRPSKWITPEANMGGIGDVSPILAHVGTAVQAVTYPIAAAVSGVGALVTSVKTRSARAKVEAENLKG